MSDSDLKNIVE